MPGWKCNVGRRLDALIVSAVPGVDKTVKWNSPLYGECAMVRGVSRRLGSPRRSDETEPVEISQNTKARNG
jgi:hypothetical protein